MFPGEDIEVGVRKKVIKVGTKTYLVRTCSLYPYGNGIHYWNFEVPYSFIHSDVDGEVFLYCFDMRGNANHVSGRTELPLHSFLVPKEVFGGKKKLKILNSPKSLEEFSQYAFSNKGVKLTLKDIQKTPKQCPRCHYEWDYGGNGFHIKGTSSLYIQCPKCAVMRPMQQFEPGVQTAEESMQKEEPHTEISEVPQVFEGQEFDARLVNNKPYFDRNAACMILGIKNTSDVMERLSEKGVVSIEVLTKGGKQLKTFIDEKNLYRLIGRSDKPQAIKFMDWVYDDVLPSIRKTGSYSVPEALAQKVEKLPGALPQKVEKLPGMTVYQKSYAIHQAKAEIEKAKINLAAAQDWLHQVENAPALV